MPIYYISKSSSTVRRKVFIARVLSEGDVAEMPCSSYMLSRSLCVFLALSTKCSECIRRGSRCDRNFSAEDFDRLIAERRRLEQALEKAA